jgi:hypothetical protein
MTNQLLAEAEALPDLDEYAGMSAVDIAQAVIHWPEGSEDQLRAIAALRQRAAGIGHNRPPLSEALEEELAPRRARADQLVATAETSVLIRGDEGSATKMIDLVRQMKELHDELNKDRLARTLPYRDATKLINDSYEALKLRLALAIGGTSGRDGCVGQLTKWDDDKKAAVEAERRRLAEEARQREAEAEAARVAAEAKTQEGKTDIAAQLEAVRARDEAERLARRAEAIRHEPTRSQLGQTTRRRQIKFVVEDFRKRLGGILKSPRRTQVEKLVNDITEHELRDLGVAAVEKGVEMPGVRAWVEEGEVNVRR